MRSFAKIVLLWHTLRPYQRLAYRVRARVRWVVSMRLTHEKSDDALLTVHLVPIYINGALMARRTQTTG